MASNRRRLARCPSCSRRSAERAFDVEVRGADKVERHFFGLPAVLCGSCGSLRLDPDAARLFGIDEADIVGAIESDRSLRQDGAAA